MKQSEAMLISACLRAGNMDTAVRHGVAEEHLPNYLHEWGWMVRWYRQHRVAPSEELFRAQFPQFPLMPVAEHEVDYLSVKVVDDFVRSQMVATSRKLTMGVHKGDDTGRLLLDAKRSLDGLVTGTAANEQEVIGDWQSTYDEIVGRELRLAQDGYAGVPTGLLTVDKVTGGLEEGELWIVAARFGEGKTWTLVSIASHAVWQGKTVQYVSLEQPRREIHKRCLPMLARMAERDEQLGYRMPGSDITVDPVLAKIALGAISDGTEGKLHIDDSASSSSSVNNLRASIERNRPDVVLVDYLTLMAPRSGDWQAIAEISAQMKSVAMEYKIPVVSAAQINRQGADNVALPEAWQLAGSDGIGQDADGIITMRYEPKGGKVIRQKLAKYRNGPDSQMWYVHFDPAEGIFEEVSAEEAHELNGVEAVV